MAWTDERVELLKKLWAEGLSASQIAGRLGGVTRNAVIGKVHRLGLSGRATSSRSSAPRRGAITRHGKIERRRLSARRGNVALKRLTRRNTIRRPAPVEELVIPLHERATILTLKESMCRWPIGDPTEEEFHFCGRKKDGTVPYCEHHARMAYQPVQARRREKRFASG
ncbi:GcrA cell cycle regulator [Methyloceanibacter marginalis]|uniref:GcrA cell cycle regulator n=1 Tax=Methyloceanibacter marginalis TaxID=1774971 RepID=A0A1E3WE12_9HYPH|nr:GcrA family cell cycle regulator [Methyloceanibacter marginalis]ODS04031.1 GcrA cell cycle regulator [Methyloceanibacter marginalis]